MSGGTVEALRLRALGARAFLTVAGFGRGIFGTLNVPPLLGALRLAGLFWAVLMVLGGFMVFFGARGGTSARWGRSTSLRIADAIVFSVARMPLLRNSCGTDSVESSGVGSTGVSVAG